QGRSVEAYTSKLGCCSITRAELTGIVTGLERAWERGIRDLEIQSDSRCAISLLTQPTSPDHQYASIVARYRRLLERNWTVSLKHIFREANHLADALAGKGHQSNLGTHTVDITDSAIRYWERYDISGSSEARRIII
ncbi:Putative ribonuclease H protein At1g65750, partial [Linum perenne]